MSQSFSISARRRYGVQRVCRNWRVPRSSVYHRRALGDEASAASPSPRRRGPRPTVTDDALLAHIRRVLAERPFVSEGYRKVHAVLRHEGIRAGHERVLRLMREHNLLPRIAWVAPAGRSFTTARSPPPRPTRSGAPT